MTRNDKAGGTLAALLCALLPITATCAHGQSMAGSPEVPVPYCEELQEITTLAMTKERFTSIVGKPRKGNFYDTKLSLTGWNDCIFYGQATYTCDSYEFKSEEEAAREESTTAKQILACLQYWDRADEQSSPSVNFIVLHPRLGPASITLNLDQAESGKPIVRLVLFIRKR